jgi:SAM-dependent methyltransferase
VNQKQLKQIADKILPASIHRWLGSNIFGEKYRPPAGMVNWGSWRRLKPLSPCFGYDRGLPIDRYYIENFLAAHQQDIKGKVLEIGDAAYTHRFGGDRVTQSDVLHVQEGNPHATIVGNLTHGEQIPSNAFDCFILTQTLHLVYDLNSALNTIYRILKPGGVILATVPGISQVSEDTWTDYWCWSFTQLSAKKVFTEVFPENNLEIEVFGNVLAATSFLQGIAAEELTPRELDYRDPHYQMLITIKAVKP